MDFDLFKQPVCPYGLKEDLSVRLELNSSEKVILCRGDTTAEYKISDISLEYDAIIHEPYTTTIGELYARSTSVSCTKVHQSTSIHYQALPKNESIWKIDVSNLSVRSLQGLLLLFFDKCNDFGNKNQEFYNSSIKKILTTINGMPHQLFAAGLQPRDIYPELKKYFYKEHSNVVREELLTTKFGLWIDTHSSTDNTYYFKLKKQLKAAIVILHVMFQSSRYSAHLEVSNPNRILSIEK